MDDTDFNLVLRRRSSRMDGRRRSVCGAGGGSRNRNVFKGSVLVSLLIESHPHRFPNRASACRTAQKLFREGHIRSIFGGSEFEDSAQLYVWQEDDVIRRKQTTRHAMTSPTSSACSNPPSGSTSHNRGSSHSRALDGNLIQDIKSKVLNRSETYNIVTSYNTFFQELERDFGYDHSSHSPLKSSGGQSGSETGSTSQVPHTSTLEHKKNFSNKKSSPPKDAALESSTPQCSHRSRDKQSNRRHHGDSTTHRESLSPDHRVSSNDVISPRSKDSSPHKSRSPLRGNETSPDKYKSTPPHIKQQLLHNQDNQVLNPYSPYQHRHHPESHVHHSRTHHSSAGMSSQTERSQHRAAKSHDHSNQPSVHQAQEAPSNTIHNYASLLAKGNQHSGTPSQCVSNMKGANAIEYGDGTHHERRKHHESSAERRHHQQHHHHHHYRQNHPSPSSGTISEPAAPSSNLAHQVNTPMDQIQTNINSAEWNDNERQWTGHDIANNNNDVRWTENDNTPSSAEDGRGFPEENRVIPKANDHSQRWPADADIMSGHDSDQGRRWPENTNSYSDNEKQLLEQMRRMKKEHQNVLRTYEGRINKLMAKMHELRNIAEMLENSSSKSSPYGLLPGKLALLNILVDKEDEEKKHSGIPSLQLPPPLPPRPGRGQRVYPNKPIIHSSVAMRPLPWTRIILEDPAESNNNTVWQGMTEPSIDTEEMDRLFTSSSRVSEEVVLFDDICLRRGKPKSQPVSVYDIDRSQRIVSELRALRCSLPDVVQAFVTLNSEEFHTDSFAELLELLTSQKELDKILQTVRRKGAHCLDIPEFLVFELSKVDHFRERLEFLRFKNKLQINLFEIDQQLRELHTACDEITTSVSLKHVLETVLAVGNYMNAGTDKGQSDGFVLDVLNSLKDCQDQTKRGNVLELIMRTYCLKFESDVEFGCPKRFRLPEPSNMRHAAQVSFDDIQRALRELKDELQYVRGKLESLSRREGSNLTIALRVTSENFLTSAVEALAEEQRLLEDTRVFFWKSTAYFSMDGQKSSPHDFFQIWASFLHDCKYYWKLAHRNLAKIKFNGDLATKSQLSSSSLPGFNNLKSVMMKHVTSFQQDEEMRASNAQQLQHINSWIESVGKYTLEMQPDTDVDHEDSAQPDRSNTQNPKSQIHHPSSPTSHYANRPDIPPFSSERQAHWDSPGDRNQFSKFKHNKGNKYESKYSSHKITRPSDGEVHGAHSSPKPIKATPPDVIKPQPLVHTSPTISSPSPTTPSLPVALSQSSARPVPQMEESDETFGFDPPYETLKHTSDMSDHFHHPPGSSNSSAVAYPINSPVSSEVDGPQKKNANFLKTFLKRDPKRPSTSDEQNPQSPPPFSSSHKSTSTPFNKLKNTFVQKLSGGSTHSKKSSDFSQSQNVHNEGEESDATISETPHDNNFHYTGGRHEDNAKYPNYYFPGPRRRPEDSPQSHQSPNARDGHDSLPSTISSLHSVRDLSSQKYRGNLLHNPGWRNGEGGSAFNQHISTKDNSDVNNNNPHSEQEREDKGPRARIRAPIALGSNMSLSDIYGRASEAARAETHQHAPNVAEVHPSPSRTDQRNFNSTRMSQETAPLPREISSPESKWVKATAVPVYKAKLIPNYENQTKLEPWIEGGVRGTAEAPTSAPLHPQQVSASSDVYKQELQKKSEQFIGSGTYPTLGQINTPKTNGIPGMPTSYTIMPPKPVHYHASPIMVGLDAQSRSGTSDFQQNHLQDTPHTSLKQNDQNPSHESFTMTPDGRIQVEVNSPHERDNPDRSSYPKRSSKSKSRERNNGVSKSGHTKTAYTHNAEKPRERMSRWDEMEKTQQSKREHPSQESKPPQSVVSLVDKFETVQDHPPGLMDGDDKPPSMTSTPLVKRKNPGSSESASQSSASRSDRSRSTSRKKTDDSVQDHLPPSKDSQTTQGSSQSQSYHVAPFFMQSNPSSGFGSNPNLLSQGVSPSQYSGNNHLPESSLQQNQSQRHQREYQRQSHSSKNPPYSRDHNYNSRNREGWLSPNQNYDISERGESSSRQEKSPYDKAQYSSSRNQYSDRSHSYTPNERSYSHTPSEGRSHSHTPSDRSYNQPRTPSDRSNSQTPQERSQSHTPGSRPRSDQSRSSSSRRATSQPSGQHQTRPATSYSSPSNPTGAPNYQGAFLPKPEPQYPANPKNFPQEVPSLSSQYSSQNREPSHLSSQSSHPHSSHQRQEPQSTGTRSSPLVSTVHPQSNFATQPSHRHPIHTPPHSHYSSLPSPSQPLMTSHVSTEANRQGNAFSQIGIPKRYKDESKSSKSGSSGFDNSLKTTPPFGRQPGAMAVVKPTVMHL